MARGGEMSRGVSKVEHFETYNSRDSRGPPGETTEGLQRDRAD